jgi:serine/threonine-protein kinase
MRDDREPEDSTAEASNASGIASQTPRTDPIQNEGTGNDQSRNGATTVPTDFALGAMRLEAAGPETPPSTDSIAFDSGRSLSNDGLVTTDFGSEVREAPGEGSQIPGYRILGVLGRGGMGLVYKAHHLALDRTVALKVILGGELAGDEPKARFLTEAQAVANVLHPNIVQIYDVGQTQELPYISLEYVDGGSLDQKVFRQPQDPRWSAALVDTIALAMHVAHRKGVIHRDLKPSNVLLTQDGAPKITDFGLAKRLESDSDHTRTGAIMGTPSYMAPEQAWGRNAEVGPQSDQYSIGAILYFLLTGSPPFQGTSVIETLEQVRTREPVRPSELQPKLHKDLETICLKCLEKEPAKRYASCEALALDLERYLRGDTILARPVSARERLWRLAQRNKKVAALTTSILILLVAVAVIATTYATILSRKNEALRIANEREKDARQEAETSAKEAFQQNSIALHALRSLGRLIFDELKDIPGAQPVRQKILNQALLGLRNAAEGMRPLYRVERRGENARRAAIAMAGTHKLLGDELLEVAGNTREALEHYQSMAVIMDEAAAADPNDSEIKMQLANSRAVLGSVNLKVLGDAKAAERFLKECLDLRKERLAREHDNDEAKLGVASALGQLAICFKLQGNPEAALALWLQEVPVRESLSAEAKRDVEAQRELAALNHRLGQISVAKGDAAGARKFFDCAFAIREALAEEHPNNINTFRDLYLSITEFGHVSLQTLKDPATAKDYYRRALAGFRELEVREPSSILRGDIARGCYYLATATLRLDQAAEAKLLYRECLELRRKLAIDPKAKLDQIDLIVAMARCGEHREAAEIARRMIVTPPKNSVIYVEVACALALCAGATSEPALKQTYTTETVTAIRKGFNDGWRDLERLQIDPDLDPVRGDPEFERLLLDFQKSIKPTPGKS